MSGSLPTRTRHHVRWPTFGWVWARPHRVLAFGFGSGLIRPGSGTWGSVLAALLWWPMAAMVPWLWLGWLCLAVSIIGVWICERTTRELEVQDHVGVVWDEIVAVWIVLWALPDVWWVLLLGFGLFRLFDIVKPWPIDQLDEHVKGGLGVMLDDWVAAGYALLGGWAGWLLWLVMTN